MKRLPAFVLGASTATLAVGTPAAAQINTYVAQNYVEDTSAVGYFGQSFTPNSEAGPVLRNIRITLIGSRGGAAAGNLYLFTSAYTGTPTGLSTATGSIGSAAGYSGNYTFASGLTLSAGQTYFAYADTAQEIRYSSSDQYSGGNLYIASSNFASYPARDAAFTVRATPEPASWMLLLGGFAIASGMIRRSRRLPATA